MNAETSPEPADSEAAAGSAVPGLPPLLRAPPWLAKVKQKALPTLSVAAIVTPEAVALSNVEVQLASRYTHPSYLTETAAGGGGFHRWLGLTSDGVARVSQGLPLEPGDVASAAHSMASPDMVLASPKAAQLALWNSYPAKSWSEFQRTAVRKLLLDYGTAAIPGLAAVAGAFPFSGFEMAAPVDSPQLVEPALQAFKHHKRGRPNAQAWMLRYPRTVLFKALPLAFASGSTKVRESARHGIRWMMNNGFDALAREAATAYGPEMTDALEALLGMDPLLVLPTRMPVLPGFVNPASFTPPRLNDGTPLPPDAAAHIATMLAISKIDAPYAGIEVLKRECTKSSLATFAWELFQAWLAAGAAPKDGWAFAALGLLGDDETARRLAPMIRNWPSEGASARAVTGLDMLAAIGSDVALTHLDALSNKAKTPALKEKAREKIRSIAQARDLTPEQLADRLVPRLGLDAEGAFELDFGPRKFFIGFDENLKPFVKDANRTRLKDLPKPNQGDDAALAQFATDRYKQIKKDAKLIADQQVRRMERAMVDRRRWSGEEFRTLFLEHPVLRHLAARLAWGVYEGDALVACLRVAEDWSLADAQDQHYALAADATVGIPHPVEMPSHLLQLMSQIFSDYEIVQPFKQLGRETFALTPQEREAHVLTRFRDKVLVTASVLGLTKRGWEPTGGDGGGWISELAKPCGDFRIDFRMEPGTIVGNPLHEPKQKIPAVNLNPMNYDPAGPRPKFGSLDAIFASEVLRDFELLVPARD